ncbi:sensor histidine kinase [Kitasatospora sp. GP82]|uniref:sensor histidine kinase n=1 Tax=Kitasatospora sp. GP82 TaxID=3035089 RepID=UPI00247358B6|nr:sensor histidine kinase [Kitasatospora sp. GP82]MDH6125312.1 signal transduction histidine kinase [Kitasatospora sp. GP82]
MKSRLPASVPTTVTAVRSALTAALRALGLALASLGPDLVTSSSDHAPLLGGSSRRWVRMAPYGVALATVATLIPTGIVHLHTAYGVSAPIAAALAIAQCVPLLAAVTRPLAAWWVMFPAAVAGAVMTVDTPSGAGPWPWPVTTLIGYLFLMLALALRESGRTLLAVWLVTMLATAGTGAAFTRVGGAGGPLPVVLCGAVLVLGWSLRGRGEARRLLAEQEQISEAERGRRTLLEERARIARELHDVVAHHMSVITVQADSAPYRITGLPPEAAEEFGTIAAAARSSLAEMRRLLGVLRSEESTPDRTPQPGLDRIPELVDTVARAGVQAELTVAEEVGALGELPQAVGLSTYRIVQEALANVVRHAPGSTAWVSLAAEDDTLRITVVNTAPPHGATEGGIEAAEGTGHGLVGMRERVRLLGGRLDTGPLPDGGFRVAAVLPVNQLEESPT